MTKVKPKKPAVSYEDIFEATEKGLDAEAEERKKDDKHTGEKYKKSEGLLLGYEPFDGMEP